MGICDSKGRVHDFAGPYTIGVDRFMVGPVTKYLPIDPDSFAPSDAPLGSPITVDSVDSSAEHGSSAVQRWDAAVVESDKMYAQQMHNICCNNCHHHSATALANAGLPTTMFGAWLMITFRGRWVRFGAAFVLCSTMWPLFCSPFHVRVFTAFHSPTVLAHGSRPICRFCSLSPPASSFLYIRSNDQVWSLPVRCTWVVVIRACLFVVCHGD
jgi:hypothetical protein